MDVLFRRTDWFKVRDERGVEGWARAQRHAPHQARRRLAFVFNLGDRAGFTTHDWELGIGGGDYGGANLISAYGAYSLTDNMKVELTLSQFLGNCVERLQGRDRPACTSSFPEWRFSPFLELGTGLSTPAARHDRAAPSDRTDQTAYAGVGAPLLSHPALFRSRRLSLAHDLHEPR